MKTGVYSGNAGGRKNSCGLCWSAKAIDEPDLLHFGGEGNESEGIGKCQRKSELVRGHAVTLGNLIITSAK